VEPLPTRLKRRIHIAAEKYLPEQRLYLRSDNSTRFLRLTAGTQLAILSASALMFGWLIIASAVFFVNMLSPGSESTQLRGLQTDYTARLNAISSERDQRALEAQKAQERFYVALGQISEMQSALLESEDHRRELETGIEVIQRTLRKTMKERDRAADQSDKLLAELQKVTGKVTTASGAEAETEETLDYLNSALEKTVRERDQMTKDTELMAARVADMKHQAKLAEERNQRIFTRLEEAVTVSMSPLEKMFENVGVSTDKLLEDVKAGYSGTGGPLTPLAISTKGEPEDEASLKANALLSELDKVNMLRIA
jgi:chromosome segregation ATPase